MLPGFSSRLEKELKTLYKKNVLGSKSGGSDKVKCLITFGVVFGSQKPSDKNQSGRPSAPQASRF
jgi:hypothetical protein